jgi:hypothetical protein
MATDTIRLMPKVGDLVRSKRTRRKGSGRALKVIACPIPGYIEMIALDAKYPSQRNWASACGFWSRYEPYTEEAGNG